MMKRNKHHDRAGIDQHLDDADEVCVERHEKRGQTEKGNDQAERARDRVAIDDDGRAEDQHEQREEPEEEGRHQMQNAEFGLQMTRLQHLKSEI